jgi:hypothetical protein
MNITIIAILAVFMLLFLIATAIYVAVEGSLLGGMVILIVIIAALLMANFLWRD